jgi:ribonucleoside-diphosphate reductase alpha chain
MSQSEEEYVLKRNGNTETVSFDKILKRIKTLGDEAGGLSINYTTLCRKIIDQLYNKIPTSEIDELTAQQCASLSTKNADYGVLAGRVLISNHQKNTEEDFKVIISRLYYYVDIHGNHHPLVSKKLFDIVMSDGDVIATWFRYDRDYLLDYFGFKTLERAYLMKINGVIVERPQHMWMRVALGIHGTDYEAAQITYNLMSQKYFTHATPTLFNAGTPRPQMSSCYLLSMEKDSINGIYNTLHDCASISKWAGGIGMHIHNIRAEGSHIRGTNGTSNGIVPMLQVFNYTARYVDQCVLPETYIYTTEGPKQIQYCEANNTNIFNTKSHECIENVLEHSYNGEILSIETMHSIDPLQITPEHPVFCIKNQKKTLNYSVIKNRLNKNIIKPVWCDAQDITYDDLLIFKIPEYEKDIENITEDDCYMYGLLLGDGCMNNTSTTCYLSLNAITKVHILDFAKKYLTDKCIQFFINRENNTNRIRWNKSSILPFRYNDIYDENKEKKIHPKWLNLPINKIKFIIKGLIDSDGCKGNEMVFDTTSRNLLESLRYLLLRMSIPTSGYIRDRIGEKHTSKYGSIIENKRISYCLRIPKTDVIAKLFNIEPGNFFKFFIHDEFIYTRIKSITKENYRGTLYDLQMKSTHNYMIHNGIVHNGGGKRAGSFAIYLEPWHGDIESFLDMKKNHGDEELRARDLFYALWIPDLFMERVRDDKEWTLMCPDKCPGLSDAVGEDFKELYEKYESENKGIKVVKARKIWLKILDSQMETGVPYMLYKDNANHKSNQKNLGTIKSSNLCCEIMEYSDSKETAVCNLASIALGRFVSYGNFEMATPDIKLYTKSNCKWCRRAKNWFKIRNIEYNEIFLKDDELEQFKKEHNVETVPLIYVNNNKVGSFNQLKNSSAFMPSFDYDLLHQITKVVTENLNKVIDKNFYPTKKTRTSNFKHRPIGIGIQGLADTFALLDIPFHSDEAKVVNAQIFETIYHAALEKSMELAQQQGPYDTFKGSPASKGILQFDMWGVYPTRYPWSVLKEQIKLHGLRNSLLVAPMPTASTSQILGFNECFEPFTSNIYLRRTLAGEFVMVNKYLMNELEELDLWTDEVKNGIIKNNGSVQNIDAIPKHLKDKYKIVWEIPMKHLIDMSADRGAFICQSQSLNLWMKDPDYQRLTSMHFYGWKKGLKTGIYYLRTKAKAAPQQFTIEPDKKPVEEEEEECLMCGS